MKNVYETSTRTCRSKFMEFFINAALSRQSCRLGAAFRGCREGIGGIMKQKKIKTHKIGLIGQAPSRRGDPRKPLAGPNGQKIARLAGISYDELIACRRRHLNTTIAGSAAEATRSTMRKATSTPPIFFWTGVSSALSCSVRTSRAALASATCLFWRRLAFTHGGSSSFRILLASTGGGTNDETNDALNTLLQRFLRGETVPAGFGKSGRSTRARAPDKLDRHIREQVSWCDLTAVISMKPASDFESLLVEIKTQNQPWLAKW